MLEGFVYNDNSRLAGQFSHGKQCHDSAVSWKDPQDLSARHKDENVEEDGIKDAIKYLIQNGLITCVLDAVLLDNRLDRICEALDALGIEQNLLQSFRILNFVGEKNFWINGYDPSCSKECAEWATETYSSDLDVEVGSKASEYLRASCMRPLKRRTGRDTSCNDHIEHRELIVSRDQGRLTSKHTCGRKTNKQNLAEPFQQANVTCHAQRTINLKPTEKDREIEAKRRQTLIDSRTEVCCQCKNERHFQESMRTPTESHCENDKSTDCRCLANEPKSVQIYWTCSCLKIIIRKAFPTDCECKRLMPKPTRISYLSLPCKCSQLVKKIFEADPSLSESCLLVMKRKFEAGLRNVCSCLNDILARLNATLIAQLHLNCDIRPGYISFRLKSREGNKAYFVTRVPICQHVRKRNINIMRDVTRNVAGSVADNVPRSSHEQTVCKCKICYLNYNRHDKEVEFGENRKPMINQYGSNDVHCFDDGRKSMSDEELLSRHKNRINPCQPPICSEKQSKRYDDRCGDPKREEVVDTKYEKQRILNVYLPCSNNDVAAKEIIVPKNLNMGIERSNQYRKEVEFIFSRDFNQDCEEKEFVLSSIDTSRNGIIGSDKTDYMESKVKEFSERVESDVSQDEKLNIERQESPDTSSLITGQEDSLALIQASIECSVQSSLENCPPSTMSSIDYDSTFECSCCSNIRSKFTPLQEIIEKLQMSPFRGLETRLIDSISAKHKTDVVPKNDVLSTSTQTRKTDKASIGINVHDTADKQSNTIPDDIRNMPLPKETANQSTEIEKDETKSDVRNQAPNTEPTDSVRRTDIPKIIPSNEHLSHPRSEVVQIKPKMNKFVLQLNSSTESEKSSTTASTNRCASVGSKRANVAPLTSHSPAPLRDSSRKNLHMREADIQLRARISLNESRKRRRIASVTKISYKTKTTEKARSSSKGRTKNSAVPSNLYGFLPNKSVDRLKQLICTKLLRMLADKASDKATNTSKTFLRNEKYVVSVLKGKLNRVERPVGDDIKPYSPGNSAIYTRCASKDSVSSEVCTTRITSSCDDSGYSKRCRCGTDDSMKNCSPTFFTDARRILQIRQQRSRDHRNMSQTRCNDIGNKLRGGRKISGNYCLNECQTREFPENQRRMTKIPSDSWHREYRSRNIVQEERNSVETSAQNFFDRNNVSKCCHSKKQRSSESLRERRYVIEVSNEPFSGRGRILRSHPFGECRSSELLKQKIPIVQSTNRTRHRKKISRTSFISHRSHERDSTSRKYRSNTEDTVICNCERCVGGGPLGSSYTRTTEVFLSDAANCSTYSGRLEAQGAGKIRRTETRRVERGTNRENFRDNEGRHRSLGKVGRAGYEHICPDDEMPKSPVLVGRPRRRRKFEKNLKNSAAPISRISSRLRNSHTEICHFCQCDRCREQSGVLKEDPSNVFPERIFKTREKRNRDYAAEDVTDLGTDFKYKLSQYVALCKSVKRTLIKRIRPDDIYELSSVSMPRNVEYDRRIFTK